jgi:hypothetical protein
MPCEESIWTVSDVNAYIEAKRGGDMILPLLPDNRLVSSSGWQDHHPQPLPPCAEFMGDLEPNVRINDENNPHFWMELVPSDEGLFRMQGMELSP